MTSVSVASIRSKHPLQASVAYAASSVYDIRIRLLLSHTSTYVFSSRPASSRRKKGLQADKKDLQADKRDLLPDKRDPQTDKRDPLPENIARPDSSRRRMASTYQRLASVSICTFVQVPVKQANWAARERRRMASTSAFALIAPQ